jgi:hypothetical protein
MTRFLFIALMWSTLVLLFACHRTKLPPATDPLWQKLKFSLTQLDAMGKGQSGTSIDYEFCIPNRAEHKAEVLRADSTVQFYTSPGRIKCARNQLLCIGNTRSPEYKRRLFKLCSLDYVQSIEQTFWE